MSLTNLFAKIAGRHQERQQARKADFKSLVKSVADGQEPDPDEVERILAETGKTLEDLQHAVELYLKRRALKATIDQKPKLEKDREQIEKQIGQASDALTAAEKKYKETTDPLLGQRDYIRDQMLEIDRARTELERTCDDQDLLNELASTTATLANLRNKAAELERSITAHRQRANDLRTAAYQLLNPREVSTRDEATSKAEAADLHSRAEHRESQIPNLEHQLTSVRDQIVDADRRGATLRGHLLVP